MMTTPKYTFLLPAFKAKFFAEALKSIKNQTYTDFLCIVSDDCSPEDLKSIYDTVVGDDSRFTFRRNAENMGSKSLVSHWNMLVDMCETEFFIMASDDDVYDPNFLEEIDGLTQKYPEVDLFRGRVNKIDVEGDITWRDSLIEDYTSHYEFLYHFFKGNCAKCLAQYVFHTNSLKAIGGFFDLPLAWGSDDATIIQMSKNGVCHTPSVVFTFRMSDLNISSKGEIRVLREKTRERYIYIRFATTYLNNILKQPLNKYEHNLINSAISSLLRSHYMTSLMQGAELRKFREMLPYYRLLDEIHFFCGKLDIIHFFWNWLRAYKLRKSCQNYQ